MLKASVKGTELNVGDTIKVRNTVVEGLKSRVQVFEGILLGLKGRAENKTMTVRRIGVRGIGVERIWPLNAPSIVGVDVVKHAKKVRRAKLYFLRELTGKSATQI